MGYTTDFEGGFNFDKPVSTKLKEYIQNFSNTRHMTYDVEKIKQNYPFWRSYSFHDDLGPNGAFLADKDRIFSGGYQADFVKDANNSGSCPSLWAQWIIENDQLVWDGGEKFYYYVEWLNFYIQNFFKPEDLILNGVAYFYGEARGDCGYIIVNNNDVDSFFAEDVTLEDLTEKYKNNEEIVDILKTDKVTIATFDRYYDSYYEYDEDER